MALVTKSFSDIITFTRTGTNATYFNSAGVLTSAGADVPRFDYNPATLAAQGLLIEEARTNFFTNASGANGGAIGTGSVSGPDNVNCRTFIPTAGAVSFPNITGPVQSFTLSLGQTVDWAWSGWFAAGPVGSFILEPRLIFSVSVNNATSFVYAELQIDTTNWTVRQKSLSVGLTEVSAPTITLFKTGLYRVTWVVRYTQDATGRNNVSASFQARNTSGIGTYTADGVSGVQYALLQAETGSFVTSTIPTTTTALTRSADVASVNTLSPWYNATEGTLYAEIQAAAGFNVAGLFGRYAAIQDALNNNSVEMFFDGPVAGAPRYRVRSGGVNQAVGSSATGYTANTTLKASLAYKVNDFAGVSRGVVDLTDTSGVVPVGPTFLSLGSEGGGINYLNGWLRRVTYYPRRLSNAELVALTAPISSTTSVQPYSLDTNFIGNTVSIGS